MKYTLLAAGLLFSINVCADGAPTSTTPAQSMDSAAVQNLFHPACKAFCDNYNQQVAKCEVRVNSGGSQESADPMGASASGTSVSIDYNFTCTPTSP